MIIQTKAENIGLIPARAHNTDAGADLKSKDYTVVHPGNSRLIDTGIAVKIPAGYVGLVFNRSSQGKIGIKIANSVGVIDSDYRGNIKVLLENHGINDYVIEPFNTKVAQLVIMPVILADFVESYETEQEWLDTNRGTGGFGSTGA